MEPWVWLRYLHSPWPGGSPGATLCRTRIVSGALPSEAGGHVDRRIPLRGISSLAIVVLAATSCAGPPSLPEVEVATWGTMREVLREGRSDGRVSLATIATAGSVGVGAMADLAGEVTILDGRVLVAAGDELDLETATPRVREAVVGDSAALLVLASVPSWEEVPIGNSASYAELETTIAKQLRQRGSDLSKAQPVRIRGRAPHLALHVIAGSCPVANPSGPQPWRFSGPVEEVELVGFYVEEATGRLTHHNRKSHLHAVANQFMGHLDEVTLEDAVLLLPAQK